MVKLAIVSVAQLLDERGVAMSGGCAAHRLFTDAVMHRIWLVVFAMRPLLHALTWHGIFWIALGGLFYTTGIVFYALDRLSYFHAFWHVFVLAGSTCHYFAVLFYVALRRS